MSAVHFQAPSAEKAVIEETGSFTPKFDANGLITAIVSDARDGALLMVAHMNADALGLTLDTGIAHYWSRSRGRLWKKGESSGNFQRLVEMRTDCDQDAVWLKVMVDGQDATCHTGRRSCFYRIVEVDEGAARLRQDGSQPRFDPIEVYSKDR